MAEIDLESILSIEDIRTHTKTDDVEYVTDAQLALYRTAAFEAAEAYTGLLLREIKQYEEPVEQKSDGLNFRKHFKFKLRHPTVDGKVYLYGSHQKLLDRMLEIEPGTRKIKIPVTNESLDSYRCCDPCGYNGRNHGMRVSYRAGIRGKQDVPATLILGVLKFIAWNVTHPGDEILTVRNKVNAGESGIIGSNNVALISGAIEMWRTLGKEF